MNDGYAEPAVDGFSFRFAGRRIHQQRSPFQLIEVYDNPSFGRMLVLDGLTQTTERDEFIYHEMLAHVPLISLPEPERVLVIGGGDGGTLRHVLMHPSVRRAVMVEIDAAVTEACRRFMPSIAAEAFDDPRAHVLFQDGIAFVNETDERFDAILIDSSDPVGPGRGLFTTEFYRAARARLAEGGIVAAQSGSPYFQQDELHRSYRNIMGAFGRAAIYTATIPTYPGCLWGFALAGGPPMRDVEVARERAEQRGLRARYWTPDVQRGSFDVPAIVEEVVAPQGPPRTWGTSPEESRRATP